MGNTGIYPLNEEDLAVAQTFLKAQSVNYTKPIVVETALLKQFYEAEEYHQDYLQKNPEGYCHINLSSLK